MEGGAQLWAIKDDILQNLRSLETGDGQVETETTQVGTG